MNWALALVIVLVASCQEEMNEEQDQLNQEQIQDMILLQCYMLTSEFLNQTNEKYISDDISKLNENEKLTYYQKYYAINLKECLGAFASPEFIEIAQKKEDEKAKQYIISKLHKRLEGNDYQITEEEKAMLLKLNELIKNYQENQENGEPVKKSGKSTLFGMLVTKIKQSIVLSVAAIAGIIALLFYVMKNFLFKNVTKDSKDEQPKKKGKKSVDTKKKTE